jgi:GTP cyclohydrolase I
MTLDNNAKKDLIEAHMRGIMTTLGLDLTDDSLHDTPRRVAKMYVDEIFYGLNDDAFPKVTVVENKFGYDQMLIECNVTVNSLCEHHFVPIIGYAHIAYVPAKKVLGLSKFNRIADYYARRPQVQERLTQQIMNKLRDVLETPDVAVVLDATHMCVRLRGIKDQGTVTRTSALSGVFRGQLARDEFFRAIPKIAQVRT